MTSPQSDLPWIAPESPDLVWFTGEDALRFLNDLISQEMGDIADGEARRSFLLAPQGKLQFLLWVVRDGDRYGLVTEPGRGEELATALNRYRIRVDVDVTVEPSDVWLVVGEGDGYDVSWPGVPRRLLVGDRPDLPEGSDDAYEQLRISAGQPAWDVDVDEGTIPHESGLVPTSVNFDKGCFLGQELVARIDSRGGNTPRRLRLVDAGEARVEEGATVTFDDTDVGTITSSSGNIGLAMIRREVSDGDRVRVGGTTAVVREIPTN